MNKIYPLTVALLIVLLAGCSTTSAEKKIGFTYTIVASDDFNPDINGQPSSAVVRVFQLTNVGNFEAALYEELFNRQAKILASELLGVNEHLIDPSSQQTFTVDISPNTKFIGVAVGYRSTDLVTWKAVQMVPAKSLLDSINVFGSKGMNISVDKSSVRLVPADSGLF